MGNKTVHLEHDVYIKLNEIQLDLKKINIKKTIYQIHDVAIRHGIDNTFEIIKNEEISI